jgi:DNA-binding NarL/FixJ family response regulator
MSRTEPKAVEPPARVLIVDDHPVVREALALRISSRPGLVVCGEAADTPQALQVAAATQPDVAIIDIALKTGSGIDLIKRLKAHDGHIRMIVWSMYGEDLYAERALRAGALGYITKEEATSKIIEAIAQVLEGRIYLSPAMTQKLMRRVVGPAAHASGRSPVELLSDRELEVFRLIGQGKKTQEIAAQLHLSVKTVETYRNRIRQKLDLSDGAALARCALQWTVPEG